MKGKQIVAGVLSSVMLFGQLLTGVSALSVGEEKEKSDLTFNNEGIWLTEIYSNDANRKTWNKSYEEIKTFPSTEDLMEFIEIFSTHKAEKVDTADRDEDAKDAVAPLS